MERRWRIAVGIGGAGRVQCGRGKKFHKAKAMSAAACAWLLAGSAAAHDIPMLDAIYAQALQPVSVDAASQGSVGGAEIGRKALLRPGEVLENVPGMIVTQHTGDGKANQYYMRGFNLDHGTDFSTSVDGVPMNLPAHAHGHGYTDLNMLMPELVDRLDYRKGSYSAEQGDFSAAGSAKISYDSKLPMGIASATVGQNGYGRLMAAKSSELGDSGLSLLYAAEVMGNDGPWENPENLRKRNLLLKLSSGTQANGWNLGLASYWGKWSATDQIPQRAVDSGLISRWGSLDKSDGGETERNAVYGNWMSASDAQKTKISAYWVQYGLDLWSNFTYAQDQVRGDQFLQKDRRSYWGVDAKRTSYGSLGNFPLDLTYGFQARTDDIGTGGLYLTQNRAVWATVREDSMLISSAAVYGEASVEWNSWLRTNVGLRGERMSARVNALIPENSGSASEFKAFPKFSAAFGPFDKNDFYFSMGRSFHTNDARASVTSVNPDPRDPGYMGPVSKYPLIVPGVGWEAGWRNYALPNLVVSAVWWNLKLDSEQVFAGDAGFASPSRASKREGLELSAKYVLAPNWRLSADLAASRAKFSSSAPEGDFVPGSLGKVASLGASYEGGPWSAGANLRYFGPRCLIEDCSVKSGSSATVNARVGYKADKSSQVQLDIYNLFDRKVSDIEYYYESRLPGEPAAAGDRHFHPAEPRSVRLTYRYFF